MQSRVKFIILEPCIHSLIIVHSPAAVTLSGTDLGTSKEAVFASREAMVVMDE